MQLTRRRLLGATGTTLLATTTLVATQTQPTSASLTMGELYIQDNTQRLDQPPSSVTLHVNGSWELSGTPPDQTRVILQVEHDNTSRDLDEQLNLDNPMSGDYTLRAGLLSHPEIHAEELVPANAGETIETEITVRVILLAISSGEIQRETYVEDTATLALTKEGLTLVLGGSGSMEVSG